MRPEKKRAHIFSSSTMDQFVSATNSFNKDEILVLKGNQAEDAGYPVNRKCAVCFTCMLHLVVLSISMQIPFCFKFDLPWYNRNGWLGVKHQVITTASNLCLRHSHVGSLFPNEEQKKTGLWCSWYFCHTCHLPCSWHHWHWLLGTKWHHLHLQHLVLLPLSNVDF